LIEAQRVEISDLKQAAGFTKLQTESKDKQIKELEKLVLLMTNSAMSTEGAAPQTSIRN
jgi:hypothetical protein